MTLFRWLQGQQKRGCIWSLSKIIQTILLNQPSPLLQSSQGRQLNRFLLEMKPLAKVVASVWGEEFIRFHATLAILSIGRFWRIGWIRPIVSNHHGEIHPINQIVKCKEFNKFTHQTETTTFGLFFCLYPSSIILSLAVIA